MFAPRNAADPLIVSCWNLARDTSIGRDGSHDFSHIQRVVKLAETIAIQEGFKPDAPANDDSENPHDDISSHDDYPNPNIPNVDDDNRHNDNYHNEDFAHTPPIPLNLFHKAKITAILHDVNDHKYLRQQGIDVNLTEWLVGKGCSEINAEEITFAIDNMSYSTEKKRKEIGQPPVDKSIIYQIVQDADRIDALGAIGIARAFTFGGTRNQKIYTSHGDKEENPPSTLHHFHEKLLNLTCNTNSGKLIAQPRMEYMNLYVKTLMNEMENINV